MCENSERRKGRLAGRGEVTGLSEEIYEEWDRGGSSEYAGEEGDYPGLLLDIAWRACARSKGSVKDEGGDEREESGATEDSDGRVR